MMTIRDSKGWALDMHIECMSNESVTLKSSHNGYTETMSRKAFESWVKAEHLTY